MSDFTATNKALFFSKNDARDPRLGDVVKARSEDVDVLILGYPDDDGVAANGGRVGAKGGPEAIRHWLYRTTPHARRELKTFSDFGDLNPRGTLEERYNNAFAFTRRHLGNKKQILSFGGGNDYAYPDGRAFLDVFQEEQPLILNIDAHFDVRDMSHGATSGTPFYRLLESGHKFDFVEFGIQGQCNSTAHWDYVESKGGRILSLDELLDLGSQNWIEGVVSRLGEKFLRSNRPTFLALDIDAFSWPYAIGSSASWPIGLEPTAFWPLYQFLLKRLDVRMLGIYEVAPALENGAGTAKLAAQFAHGFLHHV